MAWFVALVIILFVWNRVDDRQRLRDARRLLRGMGAEDRRPSPEPPSPHRLLGEVARPLALRTRERGRRRAKPDC